MANAMAAGAVLGCIDVHVVWLRGRYHHAVLPDLEARHGHGSPGRSRAHYLLADFWLARIAPDRYHVPRRLGNRVSLRSLRGSVLVGGHPDFDRRNPTAP